MSLDTEDSLPTAVAQHAEPNSQIASQSVTVMSLAVAEYCEAIGDVSSPLAVETAVAVEQPEAPPVLEPEPEPEPEADAQILEALRSPKDRLFVLKLGESMECLIQERHIRCRIELTPASTYHKLLVHRCATYYKLVPETESGSKSIALIIAPESRIPARRVADLVPPDDAPLPAFKIMRRAPQQRTRSKASSQNGSGNDDSAPGTGDVSDGDPSEAGSSRGSRKKPLTMSERQAQYEEARSRIFKDLEEKEKQKAQDMSASSSTLSLLSVGSSSGDTGGGGTSSVGESVDDAGSVDREWVPAGSKDGSRRTGSAASGSSRSLRSTAPTFNGHSHSPGFSYPTLYEPTSTSSTSSSSSPASTSSSHAPYQPTLYPVYQYGAPAYLAPYPYTYYPYPPPPPPQQASDSSADGQTQSPADGYPSVAFVNPYMWGPPPTHQGIHPPPHNQQPPGHPTQAHPEYAHVQYPPPPLHTYAYSAHPGYIQQLPPNAQSQSQSQLPPPPQSQSQSHSHPQPPLQTHSYSAPPRSQSLGPITDGHRAHLGMNQLNGSTSQPHLYHPSSYDIHGGSGTARNSASVSTGPKRGQTRSVWSYGPGVGGSGVGEAMGPRITSTRRTNSGTSVAGDFSGTKTPADETASTASSSTSSSSSRQTFTSTSSKHPLPPRPDWAVGLKPQPTLHHSNSHHSSPRAHHPHLPSQTHVHHQRPPHSMALQSNDFPPLTLSPPSTEKRPSLGGVWAGPSTTRNILAPLSRVNNANGQNGNANVNVNGSTAVRPTSPSAEGSSQNSRLDEHDQAFERPASKAGGELFNPNFVATSNSGPRVGAKSPTRRVQAPREMEKDRASMRGEAVANAILVDRVGALRIGQEENIVTNDGAAQS